MQPSCLQVVLPRVDHMLNAVSRHFHAVGFLFSATLDFGQMRQTAPYDGCLEGSRDSAAFFALTDGEAEELLVMHSQSVAALMRFRMRE